MGKVSEESFRKRIKEIHKNINIKKGIYTKTKSSVVIICEKHGEIMIPIAEKLFRRNSGCPICNKENRLEKYKNKFKSEFYKKIKEKYNDIYDYSITEYVNSATKIEYICPKHGVIKQLPSNHFL